MKRLAFLLSLFVAFTVSAANPKYVFLFIGDGMSSPQRQMAEEFSKKSGNGPLAMNSMQFQASTRTRSANAVITDSAAAATAIACGEKTNNHMSGVNPEGKPLESCAVVAKKAGKKVGIMTTVTITHATPAGFYAHRSNRGDAEGIAADLAASGFDFFAGGGLDVNEKKSEAYANAEKAGYKLIKTKEDFLALKNGEGKILTYFKNGALETSIDLDERDIKKYPSLAEIVEKAIEVLDGEQGFFIMAEGGRIDWNGHANDAAANMRDVVALDDAVKVALAFQKQHPEETIVIVTGDHETGGLSMGFAGTGTSLNVERLAKQTMSVGKFENKVKGLFNQGKVKELADVEPLMTEAFGFKFEGDDEMKLNESELAEIRKSFDHDLEFYRAKVEENDKYDGEKRYLLAGTCRRVMANKCGLSWSSGGHTALPVITSATGCGAEKFTGEIDNTDISKKIKEFYAD